VALFEQSPHIELKRYGDNYALFLNGEIQFHTLEQEESHEWMVAVPMALPKQNESVLILGGGDGFAAREAIKCGAKKITLVEFNSGMIELTKKNPIMRKLSNDSFNNSKVKIINDDAIQYVIDLNKKFDVVIDDCEYNIGDQPCNLNKYIKYLQKLPKLLNDGGVGCWMTQCEDEDTFLNEILKKLKPELIKGLNIYENLIDKSAFILKNIFPNAKSQEIEVSKDLGLELYTYFSNEPIKQRHSLNTKYISSIHSLIYSDLFNEYKK
jgi:spermidine synthase